MKRKIICFLVGTLLVATSVPALANIENDNLTMLETFNDHNFTEQVNSNNHNPTDWIEEAKLLASDSTLGDNFGNCVSISGEYAVIGAWLDDGKEEMSGSAYVFKRDGTSWTQQAKLVASDEAAYDLFGYSVSINDQYVVVGAPRDDDNGYDSGSAYVFERSGTTWSQDTKLLASDGEEVDGFGWSVSISGDHIVIGTPNDRNENGDYAGSAYIFERSGSIWSQDDKLLAKDGSGGDWLGSSVSIDGDNVIVGAAGDDDKGYDSGSAYIFKYSGTAWSQEDKLLASDSEANDEFGFSVSISENYAIVGSFLQIASKPGYAYVFKRSGTTWSQDTKLLASDGEAGDEFGFSVSISGKYALVGARRDDSRGSAYVFKHDGTSWVQEVKLLASDGTAGDFFGYSVSICGDYAIIGANGYNSNRGSAYVFKKLKADLHITNIGGLFSLRAFIYNYGPVDAENVKWSLKMEGGIILFPSGGEINGTTSIIEPTKFDIISTYVLGFGGFFLPLNIVVTAEADNSDSVQETVPARLLLFMMLWE